MRDNAVTYSKAIAIILMVLGHACANTQIEVWVNMFHVPVFYFMSGYCFKEAYLNDFRHYSINRIKGLYWPFVKWGLFFLLIHNVLLSIGIYNNEIAWGGVKIDYYTPHDMIMQAIGIIFKISCPERLLGGYWFLKTLLIGSFIFYLSLLTLKTFKPRGFNSKMSLFLLASIIMLISCLMNFAALKLYIVNYQDSMAAFFIFIGYLYKRISFSVDKHFVFLLLAFLLVTIGSIYWPGAAVGVKYQNQIPFMVTAVIGSMAILGLCRMFEQSQFGYLRMTFNYIGNNTLTILTWHFSTFVLVNYIIIKIYHLPLVKLAEFPVIFEYNTKGWIFIYCTMGMIIPGAIAYMNRFIKSPLLKF